MIIRPTSETPRSRPSLCSGMVLLVLAVALAASSAYAESILPGASVVPEEGAPGEIVRLIFQGDRAPETVELIRADERVAVSDPITIRMTDFVEMRIFLLGLDPTLTPGSYTLRGVGASDADVFEEPFSVLPYEFRREEIALNRTLTSLRREYDPRKVEESRVLTALILSRDPAAMFHPGRLAWPLPEDTRRTAYFGDRRTYLYVGGERAAAIHVGLDLASPVGTPVTSSGVGVVRMARDRIVTGKTVVIEHLPGVFSLYYHLDELSVDEEAMVGQGEIIGTVGMTGLATGPHLHWEIRVGGVPVSPEIATQRPLLFGIEPAGNTAVTTGP